MRYTLLLLGFISLFSACEENDGPTFGECLDPVNVRFDSLWVEGEVDSMELVEKIFAPSAFTPNGDSRNDNFLVHAYLADENAVYSYLFKLYVNNQLYIQKTGVVDNPFGGILFEWNGMNAGGQKHVGVYRLDMIIAKNQTIIINQSHDFYLFLPALLGSLPAQYECLTFSDQYDSRLGLVYETGEQFD